MTRILPSALLLGALLTLVGCAAQPQAIEGQASAASAASPTTTSVPAVTQPTTYSIPSVIGRTRAEAVQLLASAGFTNVTTNVDDPNAIVQSQHPVGSTTSLGDAIDLVLEVPEPAREISSRDWALIAKSPDSHIGERIIVYGYVTQFDSATGTSVFRAGVDGDEHSQWYEYETNTFLAGTAEQFAGVVKDDIFRAEVTVTGTFSYTTTMGGTMTVPQLTVDKIDVIGSTS